MVVVLYENERGEKRYTEIPNYNDDNIPDEVFASFNIDPDKITYIFSDAGNLCGYTENARIMFHIYHSDYGFASNDLDRCFYIPGVGTYRFAGLLPKKTKYKCLIFDIDKHTCRRATVSYVKNCLASYPV